MILDKEYKDQLIRAIAHLESRNAALEGKLKVATECFGKIKLKQDELQGNWHSAPSMLVNSSETFDLIEQALEVIKKEKV